MSKKKLPEEIRLTLPIPNKIYQELKDIAKEEERSLTSQIIYILKKFCSRELTKEMQDENSDTTA